MPITEYKRERDRRKHEEAKAAYAAFIPYYPLTLEDLPGEVWKDIAGYSGEYQVSTFGRVKSFKYKPPRILKPHLVGLYLSVDLCGNDKTKRRLIHVLVAQAFIPNPLNKPEVNHIVGCKFNCHVSNLYWATHAENQQHAVKNGLSKSGVDRPDAKFKNEETVHYIRENPDNLTQQQLAEMFGVHETNIGAIQRGESYQNAGGNIRKKSEHPHNYISDEIREQILADWATGQYSQRALARKFGYSHTTISNIVQG